MDEEGEAKVRSLLSDRVLPFTAAAIVANAELATDYLEDLRAFEAAGLRVKRDVVMKVVVDTIDWSD